MAENSAEQPSSPISRSRHYGLLSRLIGDGLVVLLIASWWYLSLGLPDYVMPSPQAVAVTLLDLFIDPSKLAHVLTSAARVVTAVLVAVALGTALALLPRRWP